MIRLTLATVTLAILLLCGSPSRIEAQGDTKIVVGDSSSILLRADGLDAGGTWTLTDSSVLHARPTEVLRAVTITDAGADKCGGSVTCGIDTASAWKIHVIYGNGSVTFESTRGNKGLHLIQRNLPFTGWQRNGNKDERVFGHNDGLHITSVKVNNGVNNGKELCSGKGACLVAVTYP
jgi:hypothetical protein